MNTVAANIRRIMADKGQKQKYVAEKAGFTEQEFSNMLCGRKKIDIEYIDSICFALETDANSLFLTTTGKDPNHEPTKQEKH